MISPWACPGGVWLAFSPLPPYGTSGAPQTPHPNRPQNLFGWAFEHRGQSDTAARGPRSPIWSEMPPSGGHPYPSAGPTRDVPSANRRRVLVVSCGNRSVRFSAEGGHHGRHCDGVLPAILRLEGTPMKFPTRTYLRYLRLSFAMLVLSGIVATTSLTVAATLPSTPAAAASSCGGAGTVVIAGTWVATSQADLSGTWGATWTQNTAGVITAGTLSVPNVGTSDLTGANCEALPAPLGTFAAGSSTSLTPTGSGTWDLGLSGTWVAPSGAGNGTYSGTGTLTAVVAPAVSVTFPDITDTDSPGMSAAMMDRIPPRQSSDFPVTVTGLPSGASVQNFG